MKRILRKTGLLFSAACALGAECAGLDDAATRAAARFGLYYGGAFQIADDLLDMESTSQEIGKPAQNDLKEGIITLPALLAALGDPVIRSGLEGLFGGAGDIASLSRDILRSDGIAGARGVKERMLAKARRQLAALPETKSRDLLAALTEQL
jgi:heptaprenyl diphosphate synthase